LHSQEVVKLSLRFGKRKTSLFSWKQNVFALFIYCLINNAQSYNR